MDSSWTPLLSKNINNQKYKDWLLFLEEEEKKGKKIFPKKEDRMRVFNQKFKDVKVVIVGQDPYHGENEANGLAFAVNENIKIPPSLRNIFKEVENSGYKKFTNQDRTLKNWEKQGVFLLNTVLSVEENKPLSHEKGEWHQITDLAIEKLSLRGNVVFVLWGKKAEQKISFINKDKNEIIITSHPSPFSARRTFLNSNIFAKINQVLISWEKEEINW